MKRFLTIAAVIGWAMLALTPGQALAERRVALIVGNSNYSAVPQLPNPARDANAIAKLFKDAGFDTIETHLDVGNLDFKRAIRKFEDTAVDADIAVLFYAGHGIEIGGTNYLIPIDAKLASDRDAPDEAIPLDRLVLSADGARKLRVIILDACRDNPYAGKMRRESRAALRAVSSGLSKVEPSSTDTLIAYAAKAGSTAEDGDRDHSPFTAALLKHLTVPGLDLRLAFGRVKDEVMKSTSGRQEPFVYGSLGGGNYSLVAALPEGQSAVASISDVKTDYQLVEKVGTKGAWEVFLSNHKTGFYADLAREQLAKFAALEPAPVPQPPRGPSTRELLAWERVKDTSDIAALKTFVKQFPDSTLAVTAQHRIDILEQNARERDAAARAAREEAERKKAEAAAAKRREDEERRAAAAEAAQKAKAAEAERRAEEARRKAEEAARTKAAAEAEKLRQESERVARQAEAERKKAEAAAAEEAVCKTEGELFDAIVAKGSESTNVESLKRFAQTATCARIKPQITAKLEAWTINTPDLIKAAQTQLTRINCYTGEATGVMTDDTRSSLTKYLSLKKRARADSKVTEDLVAELSKQAAFTCPLVCPSGHTAQGATCVAVAKPVIKPAPQPAKPVAVRREPERKQQAQRRETPKQQPRQQQRQQASSSGGGGGRAATMIGVGF
ncbi:caspase (peptidase) [Afipia sp. P52-10]|uniref:caspase family protein n=1 Tax=Afipia sp. P52-10 TaxID=1429916 RepID=UPI0003DEF7AB|nr:caspase family protein [Afipia sp. P52-10]ETR78128.1 caspase (peptidase) [Afipia sp. P52-10]